MIIWLYYYSIILYQYIILLLYYYIIELSYYYIIILLYYYIIICTGSRFVLKLDGIVVLLHFRTLWLFWKGGFGTRGAQESWRKVGWNLSQICWLNITVRSVRIFRAMVHGGGRRINETSHMYIMYMMDIVYVWVDVYFWMVQITLRPIGNR